MLKQDKLENGLQNFNSVLEFLGQLNYFQFIQCYFHNYVSTAKKYDTKKKEY